MSRLNPTLLAFLFTLPPLIAAAAGGALAVWRPPRPKVTSAIQHLAAGIVFAATALELIPAERTKAAMPVVIGFALGLAAMLGLRVLEERFESRPATRGFPLGLVLVAALDFLIDGLVLGIAFAAGEKSGILLAIALTLEVLFVALSVTAAVSSAGSSRLTALGTAPGMALVLCAGTVAGRLFFGGLGAFAFAVMLGIGIVAMLYLVTEELLVEAHEVEETHWSVTAFFGGFLAFFVIEILVG